MDIKFILHKVLPPRTFEGRDGFDNREFVSHLSNDDKELLENKLIERLNDIPANDKIDELIIETLAFLKSKKSIELIRSRINEHQSDFSNLIITVSLYNLTNEPELIDVALNYFKRIENSTNSYVRGQLNYMFHYLSMLQSDQANSFILKYTKSEDKNLRYNAFRALNPQASLDDLKRIINNKKENT